MTCNATGNATTLEICRILSKHRQELDRDVYFVFWDGHEVAEAAGSTWFVDNNWDKLNKHCVCYMHIDSTGVKETELYEIKASEELLSFAKKNINDVLPELELRAMALKKIGDQSFMGIGVSSITQRKSFTKEYIGILKKRGSNSMKIKVVIPNSGMSRGTLNARELMLSHAVSPAVIISVDCIPSGPRAIESNTDEVLAGSMLIDAAVQAERDGYDAFVVYCFSDLAVDAIRENVSIPVVGPGEVALAAAGIVANRFAVITTVEENISRTYRRLMQNAVAQRKMSSVRALNIPVVALREDPNATMRYLKGVCEQAIEEDQIDTVVLGCLGMAQYGEEVERCCGVKVIDPAPLALACAELAARLNLCPSRRSVAAYRQEVAD